VGFGWRATPSFRPCGLRVAGHPLLFVLWASGGGPHFLRRGFGWQAIFLSSLRCCV